MSILADEILGKGALYGRFRYHRIEAFTDYYGKELALRAAKYYQVKIPEIMAPVISDRCGGNPFYINAVVQQAAEQGKAINDEATLNNMLAIDITSGFIWRAERACEQMDRPGERVWRHEMSCQTNFLEFVLKGIRGFYERLSPRLAGLEDEIKSFAIHGDIYFPGILDPESCGLTSSMGMIYSSPSVRTGMDIVPAEKRGRTAARVKKIRTSGQIIVETDHMGRKGKPLHCELNSRLIEYKGKPAVLSIARDLTDRKRAEEEKQRMEARLLNAMKMEALGALAGGVAHDLNPRETGISIDP